MHHVATAAHPSPTVSSSDPAPSPTALLSVAPRDAVGKGDVGGDRDDAAATAGVECCAAVLPGGLTRCTLRRAPLFWRSTDHIRHHEVSTTP